MRLVHRTLDLQQAVLPDHAVRCRAEPDVLWVRGEVARWRGLGEAQLVGAARHWLELLPAARRLVAAEDLVRRLAARHHRPQRSRQAVRADSSHVAEAARRVHLLAALAQRRGLLQIAQQLGRQLGRWSAQPPEHLAAERRGLLPRCLERILQLGQHTVGAGGAGRRLRLRLRLRCHRRRSRRGRRRRFHPEALRLVAVRKDEGDRTVHVARRREGLAALVGREAHGEQLLHAARPVRPVRHRPIA
jgi:hypothetical protein